MARVLDEFEDGILGFLNIIEYRGNDRGQDVIQFIVARYIALRSRLLGANRLPLLHLVQRLFHLQQLGRHR